MTMVMVGAEGHLPHWILTLHSQNVLCTVEWRRDETLQTWTICPDEEKETELDPLKECMSISYYEERDHMYSTINRAINWDNI